jgi:phage gp29-like protein
VSAIQILDQYGQPIDRAVLQEPQTAKIASLQNQYLIPMLGGLTPSRLARTLQEADHGNLIEQHRLFADMEERDAHLRAEMDKRKNAIVGLAWDIIPPRNASAAEKAAAAWVREVLQDAVDPMEDLLQALMDGVGHGFAPVELEWRKQGDMLLPAFHPRPQEWFRLNSHRTELTLRDASMDGISLLPFGWVMHTPGKAKTGYLGRMGLYRTLVWPFLYKAYAVGDFAEFLETYGLPIIVGKYFAGASADEKASLMRAVAALGHDARAIMPAEMQMEISPISTGGNATGHMTMIEWAEKALSKGILGQTLSADDGNRGSGGLALGKVHNEVRHDIMSSDARQLGATLTRDLVYPLIALNRGGKDGINGLERCPRFVLDDGEPDDMTAYADALPKLVAVGFQVPLAWAQEKLRIPQPQDGEPVLTIPTPAGQQLIQSSGNPPASGLSATSPAVAALATATPVADDPAGAAVDQLASFAAPIWSGLIDRVKAMVDQATDLTVLQKDLIAGFGGQPQDKLVKLMAAAFDLAELKGLSDVQDGK